MITVPTAKKRQSLKLHRGQMLVYRHPARYKVVVAGRRWGKTQLSKISIIKYAAKPKQLIWYVAPTYRMARQIMWRELTDAIPRKLIRRMNETMMIIHLVNGTIIELKGADKPDTLRGVGLHFVVLDEFQDIKPEVWETVLRPTLASTLGHALIIGTPKAYNHLHKLFMMGQRDGRTWMSWQFPTLMSPFIPPEEIEAAKADMDEKTFNQEFNAAFETMSGRVYYTFDRNVHVGKYDFNPALPIWIGQDFNIDPMSAIILQPQPNGEVWAVDECVRFSSNTEDMGAELERRYWRYLGKNQITLYPDPAGASRQHGRGESDLDIMREIGFKRIKYRKKHPPVADRVNAVNRLLMSASGRVILRIDERCKHLIKAFEQVLYKKGSREVDKSAGIEHIADAIGYPIELEFPMRRVQILGVSL
ncbi:phage terminase large subunit family protein [Chitinibacter tainanensis]|uniref:phage terminase large subunit family protein n=1 Tax=Chitinibacter tainanensis TaxID=230667 RepID=UPI0003F57D3E|nr:terminase [Chitinibacter tainanensis]